MGWLATLALYLTVDEIAKLTASGTPDRIRENIAAKLIANAEKQGEKAINDALNAINNVPNLAGSPTLNQLTRDAKRRAISNYKKVESAVADMKYEVNKQANDILRINDKSVIEKMFTGATDKRKVNSANQKAEEAFQKFEQEIK